MQKALLELHSVSGQLCACVLSKPLVHSPSVCTTLIQSAHTDTHAATFPLLSVSLFVFLYISTSHFACISLLFMFLFLFYCGSPPFTRPVAWGIMQSYQKKIVSHAHLCLHVRFISEASFSSLWSTVITAAASHPLKLILLRLQGVNNKEYVCWCYSSVCIFLPH